MLKGWWYDGHTISDFRKKLDEISDLELSQEDLDFFTEFIQADLSLATKTAITLLPLFLSNEKRFLCILNNSKTKNILRKLIITFDSILSGENHETISQKSFLFKNFPPHLFNSTGFGKGYFFLMCYSFQYVEECEFSFCDYLAFPFYLNVNMTYIETLKKIIPQEKYVKRTVPFLMKFSKIKKFVSDLQLNFLKKINGIIETKDVFLLVKRLNETLSNILYLRGEVSVFFNKIKENYTHFVPKKIILPRIERY